MTPAPRIMNDFARECRASNDHWWRDPSTGEPIERNQPELLMLVVTEIAEAMEGRRKSLMDDKLPWREMAEVELADVLIRCYDTAGGLGLNLQDDLRILIAPIPAHVRNDGELLLALTRAVIELANSLSYGRAEASQLMVRVIRQTEMIAERWGYDVYAAVAEKRNYNLTRADHKAEARLGPNGKKW